ncbi:auxin-responsive protein SAUR72 [Ananas comosus]|uniref:Auxin-responsive protein SAUR71 n=1 Tax=Ananas comosus TaxID=4615 RepID=A0A199UXV8_ANACO|nr:auxin-responsive protein SAUR72 [Ananas comosus]OAY69475.1 Auxin-responsive protein SAUR71 [Ananas comosus]
MEYSNSKKPNKITEIVRLQQMLKKWKKLSVSPRPSSSSSSSSSSSRGIKFLKRTLSFTDTINTAPASAAAAAASVDVPKGYLAVCVGEEMQRYVIPTEYLGHRAFEALLREAEEEFGFQQEGVLRIPCEVGVFESILTVVEKTKDGCWYYCSSESSEFAYNHFSPDNPLCR